MKTYDKEVLDQFCQVTTATLSTVMFKMGVTNTWIRGAFPLTDEQPRVAGPAFTMRFIPAREDLATPAAWSSPTSTRAAVEAMPGGCIAVVGTDGCTDAGVFGDILCQRMKVRGVEALLTDGVVRDLEGVIRTRMSVWAQGVAAPAAVASLTFVNWQEPVGCGGVAIYPGDLIVADRDGALVIPHAMVEEVQDAALAQEQMEEWILQRVRDGDSLPGLYPPNEENQARYEQYRKSQNTKN